MKVWARTLYVATFLILATLPFDPLLNQRFVVFPLCAICVALGLIAMYLCTLPDRPVHSGNGGTK